MNIFREIALAIVVVAFVTASAIAQDQASIVGFWAGAVERNGKTWNVQMNATSNNGELNTSITFVDLDVPDVSFPIKRTERGFRLERPQPSGHPIVFDGMIEQDAFVGKWAGFGVEGTFSMKRSVKPSAVYDEEEVVFTNGDVKLSGTLLIPTTAGKHAAVVITHGSVPNERTTYRSWGRGFAEAGIAALIYDKRGSGKSTGDTRGASMEDLADDALAGVRMLKLRPDINPVKIGVAGHSQGGWIAPLAAVRSSRDVAFVIVSGAAAVTPAEQSVYHRAGVMRSQGVTDKEIEKASRLRQRLYDLNRLILAGKPYQKERAAISQELSANKDTRWFALAELPPQLAGDIPPLGALKLLFFDPTDMWRSLKVPVLVLWGDNDTVVPVDKSREIIERLQVRAGNDKRLTIKLFPGVDHGNNVVRRDTDWDFPRVNVEYIPTMIDWTRKLVM